MILRVSAAAPDVRPADIQTNKERILEAVSKARKDQAAILVLPAHCLTGIAGDLENLDLLKNAVSVAEEEILQAAGSMTVIPFHKKGLSADELSDAVREDVLCCSSDRPATAMSFVENEEFCAMNSLEKKCVVAMATPNGCSSAEFVYTGQCVLAQNGYILASDYSYVSAEIDTSRKDCREAVEETICDLPENPWLPLPEAVGNILPLQAKALALRLQSAHSENCVIGVSGGLDSTLALLVCCEAMDLLGLPRKNILTVTMPCFGTTERTKSNAQILSEALQTSFRTIDIKASVELHMKDIGHESDITNNAYENAQARERTQILMDLANDVRGLVVGTGDLSEIALGWCTYNGDHMSMYGVNCGLPKTVIRAVLKDYAEKCSLKQLSDSILDVIDTPVSPELLPSAEGEMTQLTEDIIGPYELHDCFLYYFLKNGFSPAALYKVALETFSGKYSPETIKKWLGTFFRRFFTSQFKRSCSPDGPAVLGLSFSPRSGFRFPSDCVGTLWMEELQKL